jgi:hypothetical protein
MPDKRDMHKAKSKRNHKTPTGKNSRSAAPGAVATQTAAAENALDSKAANQSRKH